MVLCLCGGDTVAIFYLIVVFVCFGTDGVLKARRYRSEQQQRTSGVFLWSAMLCRCRCAGGCVASLFLHFPLFLCACLGFLFCFCSQQVENITGS